MQNVVDNILYCIVAFEIVVYGIHNTPYDEGVNHTQALLRKNCVRSLFMGKRKYPDIMTKKWYLYRGKAVYPADHGNVRAVIDREIRLYIIALRYMLPYDQKTCKGP